MAELKGKAVTDEGVLEEIAARYRRDDRFRIALRKDPKAALISLGVDISGFIQLQVKGDTPETECLCLDTMEELTDEEMRRVMGGVGTLNTPSLPGLLARSSGSVRLPGAVVMPLYGI